MYRPKKILINITSRRRGTKDKWTIVHKENAQMFYVKVADEEKKYYGWHEMKQR
jgi:DUF438 domain-containing protein